MNGQRLLVPADSATTVQEMCQAIARKIGLRETAGFSLYAAIYKRVSFIYFILQLKKRNQKDTTNSRSTSIVSTNDTFLHSHTRILFTSSSIVGKILKVFDLTWDAHTRTYRPRIKMTHSLLTSTSVITTSLVKWGRCCHKVEISQTRLNFKLQRTDNFDHSAKIWVKSVWGQSALPNVGNRPGVTKSFRPACTKTSVIIFKLRAELPLPFSSLLFIDMIQFSYVFLFFLQFLFFFY